MGDKKFTPAEAAMAVLNKAKELYKESTLAKAETGHEKGIHTAANFQVNRPGVSHAGVSARSAKINETKGAGSWQNVNEAKNRQKKVLNEMQSMPKPNLGKSEEMSMKGHIKLAKFVGRMEAKRGMAKSETGHEKGVATKPNPAFKEGMSAAGVDVRAKDTGAAKQQSIGRMMDAEKIKPKLP
jgi:hypothetical protein